MTPFRRPGDQISKRGASKRGACKKTSNLQKYITNYTCKPVTFFSKHEINGNEGVSLLKRKDSRKVKQLVQFYLSHQLRYCQEDTSKGTFSCQ